MTNNRVPLCERHEFADASVNTQRRGNTILLSQVANTLRERM